jgi:chloramphenicol 3-O-phosphotransferase
VAGRIAAALLAERDVVVLEGDFRSAAKRAELEETLPVVLAPLYVSLHVGYAEALPRAIADPSRGASRDPGVLSSHYATVEAPLAGDLVLDTGALGVDEVAQAVVDQLLGERAI